MNDPFSDYDPFDPNDKIPLPEPAYRQFLHFLRELAEAIVPAVILALLITQFVAQAKIVHGRSMEPNLHTGQRVIIEKISYHFYQPERGDIIVVSLNDDALPLIKRVIALPGETISIEDGRVLINGRVLDEPYLSHIQQRNYATFTVPPNHVFVMGDNRLDSRDSRVFGPVHLSQIEGKAWLSVWPPEDMGPLE